MEDLAGKQDAIKGLVDKIVSSVEITTDEGVLDHVTSILTTASTSLDVVSSERYINCVIK